MITERERTGKLTGPEVIASAVAHALAWTVYLVVAIGLVLWPVMQGQDGEDLKVLATVFLPVSLTGLGVVTIVTNLRWSENKPKSLCSMAFLGMFSALGIFSVSQMYLPLQLKVVVGLTLSAFPLMAVTDVGKAGGILFLAILCVLLWGFCIVAAFSVGIFFAPSALALLASTILWGLRKGPQLAKT